MRGVVVGRSSSNGRVGAQADGFSQLRPLSADQDRARSSQSLDTGRRVTSSPATTQTASAGGDCRSPYWSISSLAPRQADQR